MLTNVMFHSSIVRCLHFYLNCTIIILLLILHYKMFRNLKTTVIVSQRTFKNFGHKRQPIPFVTTLWHGFLTFTFIGLGIEWKRIKTFLFGAEGEDVFVKNTSTEDSI